MTPLSYDERLQLTRGRLGIAQTPAERAARGVNFPGQNGTAGTPPLPPAALSAMAEAAPPLSGPAPTVPGQPPAALSAMPTAQPMPPAAQPLPASARAPAPRPAAPAMQLPPGMTLNPAAFNYGRLSEARTDVPLYTEARPAGLMPPAPATLLPTGNPQARRALLQAQFPNASRSDLNALSNLATVRPEIFNQAVSGTRLDPAAAGRREAGEILGLAGQQQQLEAGAQTTRIQRSEAERRAAGDTATANFFTRGEDAALRAAARAGAPAATLFEMASLAEQRKRAEASQPKAPYETTINGRPAVVTNGNVIFADNDPRRERPAQPDGQPQVSNDGKFYWKNGAWERIPEPRPDAPLTMQDIIAAQAVANNPALAAAAEANRRKRTAATAAEAAPAAAGSDQNKAALDWARANPNDPRAAAILKKLGVAK